MDSLSSFLYMVLLLAALLINFVICIELRCHCNFATCNRTNDMCKTKLGCFQELPSHDSHSNSHNHNNLLRHGCLEMWPSKRPYQCVADVTGTGDNGEVVIKHAAFSRQHSSDVARLKSARRHNTVALRCCLEDMCNFVASRTATVGLNVLTLKDAHTEGGTIGQMENGVLVSKTPSTLAFGEGNAWFLSALIVVPLLGVLILMLLVVFGCYLLKFDVNVKQRHYDDVYVEERDELVSPVLAKHCQSNSVGYLKPKSKLIGSSILYPTSTTESVVDVVIVPYSLRSSKSESALI